MKSRHSDHARNRESSRGDERSREYGRGSAHYRGYDERESRAAPRRSEPRAEEYSRSRSYFRGGEYLRDVPEHRVGRPDATYEYEHGGDYSDPVVGGDYVRGYGYDPRPDLYDRRADEALERLRAREHPRSAAGDYDRLLSGFGEGGRRESGSAGRGPSGGESQARGYRGRGPRNYVRSDERILEDVSERLTEDDAVDASDIGIDVQNGIVTLNGSVEQRWIKHRVEDIAESCSGVKDVVNHLRVEPAQNSIPPPPSNIV